mgnify:CR=1 FL=1
MSILSEYSAQIGLVLLLSNLAIIGVVFVDTRGDVDRERCEWCFRMLAFCGEGSHVWC